MHCFQLLLHCSNALAAQTNFLLQRAAPNIGAAQCPRQQPDVQWHWPTRRRLPLCQCHWSMDNKTQARADVAEGSRRDTASLRTERSKPSQQQGTEWIALVAPLTAATLHHWKHKPECAAVRRILPAPLWPVLCPITVHHAATLRVGHCRKCKCAWLHCRGDVVSPVVFHYTLRHCKFRGLGHAH